MQTKLFTIQIKSIREQSGYNDRGALFLGSELLWHGNVGGVPNPDMFCIYASDLKSKIVWKPMSQITVLEKTVWCSSCNKSYCPNYQKTPGPFQSRIGCKNYGQLAPNKKDTYKGRFIADHGRFGRCILINEGKELTSISPSGSHNGAFHITEVFIHRGAEEKGWFNGVKDWRGSAACITIPPSSYIEFMKHFKQGELIDICVI